jgi:hypothetical protein
VSVGDLDNDGAPDYVSLNAESGVTTIDLTTVLVRYHPETQAFSFDTYTTGPYPYSEVLSSDLGKLAGSDDCKDLAVLATEQTKSGIHDVILIFKNRMENGFCTGIMELNTAIPTNYSTSHIGDLKVRDIDNDGNAEILVGDHNTLAIYGNEVTGYGVKHVYSFFAAATTQVGGIALAKFNGMDEDVVVVGKTLRPDLGSWVGFALFFDNQGGSLTSGAELFNYLDAYNIGLTDTPVSLGIGDMNGDGAKDLVFLKGYWYNEMYLVQQDISSYRKGDVNCDGSISFGDINPFVSALSSRQQYETAYPYCFYSLADINRDGVVSFADINPFVALLSGPAGQ